MNRRAFLLRTGGGVLAAVAGGLWLRRTTISTPDVQAMLTELKGWRGRSVTTTGSWSPAQIFTHLAQSIEYSMTGYPEMKPALFQKTAGSAAFFVFSSLGKMKHNLADPIPGAPSLETSDTGSALDRLITALQSFHDFSGELRPHFAYGALSKAEYAAAHLMHIRDHQREFTVEG